MKETPITITDEQAYALSQVHELLRRAFPEISEMHAIHRHLLPYPLAAVGSSVICYGDDPETGERVILVIDRKEVNAEGEHYLGLLGGYVELNVVRNIIDGTRDISRCEQPHEGVIAEAAEESKDGHDRSLIVLDASRLELVSGGINDQVHPPVAYFSYIAEMTTAEIMAVKTHIKNLKDKDYKANSVLYSGFEVFGMHLYSLKEAEMLDKQSFLYHHTWLSLQKGLEKIRGATRHNFLTPSPTPTRSPN